MPNLATAQIAAALDSIDESIAGAHQFYRERDNPWSEESAAWQLKKAYTTLLAMAEALGMPTLRAEIAAVFATAREAGLTENEPDPDGDPFLKWAAPASLFADALRTTFAVEPSRTITKDLESILRASTYAITDTTVFGGPPGDEAELHRRLEAVLRCLFPDLITKPRLGKPIRHFIPDTGLPSLKTLLEYKFQVDSGSSARIVEEILTDTRGYHSSEWDSIIFVVYETARFQSELQWRQMLRAAGVGETMTVVVLSGSPPIRRVGRGRRH
jgi:hypothetical protein